MILVNIDHARQECEKIASLISTARRLVSEGTLVDLSAIEERVRQVCGGVGNMKSAESQKLIGDLETLLSKLELLGGDLRERLSHIAPSSGDQAG